MKNYLLVNDVISGSSTGNRCASAENKDYWELKLSWANRCASAENEDYWEL